MDKYEAFVWVLVVGAAVYGLNRLWRRRQRKKKRRERRVPCAGCAELISPKARVCPECGYRYAKRLRIRLWAEEPEKAVEKIKRVIPNARFRHPQSLIDEGLQFDVPDAEIAEKLRVELMEQGIRVRVEEYYK